MLEAAQWAPADEELHMQRLMTGLVILAATATAYAEDRIDLPGLYENTWELRRSERAILIFLNADGTWDGIFDGVFYNGRDWRTVNGHTCFFTHDSKPDSAGMCFRDLAARKPGDSWQLTVVGRDLVWDAKIHEGRKVPPVDAKK